jgi:CBS domain containing-hemolysin-like protein
MLSSEERFSNDLIHKLRVKGFSRVPVYLGNDRHRILGTFNTKSMLRYNDQDYGKTILTLVNLNEPLIVS